MEPLQVAEAFVDRINAQDVDGLCGLMTEDHLFLDGMGTEGRGREHMRSGWKWYFAMVPDYWVTIEKVFQKDNVIALFGNAGGTYTRDGKLDPRNKWQVPAAWQAVIKDDKVAVWRVYADNEPIRQIIARVEEETK
jgi:ketosteroid isomerase-like protein